MANASSKRIASANETALKKLRQNLLIVNAVALLLRYLFSTFTSKPFRPSWFPLLIQISFFITSIIIWRWFVLIGTPKRDSAGGLKAGEDLGGKGVIEFAWDLIYMTWICTIGSAILGNWVWWLSLLIPGFGIYKLFNLVRPILGMFLPSLFGPRQPKTPGGAVPAEAEEKGESKKQAKLRARMEKGDKRIQQVQRK